MARVQVRGLRKSYNGAAALDGVDLLAEQGELLTLLGPSGCGKTTTLRCIAGFLQPDGGDILVDGASVLRTKLRHRNFGVVFQSYALFPHMTVAENVGYGLRVRGVGRAERDGRVAEALRFTGLAGLADRLPRALSGGQQQRVALARALVVRPRLLLLDEPLANLDARLRGEMRALIRRVQQEQGVTAFYVTHDQAEAMAVSDRVAVMERGRVAQCASPREIYRCPVSPYVAAFTGDVSVLPVEVLGTDGPGIYRVRGGGAAWSAAGPAGLDPAAEAALRPEAMCLVAPGTPGSLPGTVREASFTGASLHCTVAAGDALLSVVANPDVAWVPGEPVGVAVDPTRAWLMRSRGAAPGGVQGRSPSQRPCP